MRILFFLLFALPGFSQQADYPKNYFRAPLDIPLELSGNFGELRPNHFHTGIDITTHNVEGVPVKAAADGYVSRIKIGPWGYGRVIYITHPNGYTTVYGHLSNFNTAIAAYIKNNQYANESFEIELIPKPEDFPVKKGEIIAYSGNTGSSGGPHLHFEIRDTKTEEAINPLLFGMPVKDNVPPVIVSLLVTPADPSALINGSNTAKKIKLIQSGKTYVFANAGDSIVTYGKIGFAIEAYDKETVPTGKNGVYSIRLKCDKKTIYAHRLERMPFDKSRYINCFIDYPQHEKTNVFYQRSFLLPNNQLPVYDTVINNGYCTFKTDSLHRLEYAVADAYGNTVTLAFKVHSRAKGPGRTIDPWKPFVPVLLWDTVNVIDESAFRLETPSGAVYDDVILDYTIAEQAKSASPKISFDRSIPLQKECVLTVYGKVPEKFRDKAVLALISKSGSRSSAGGKWSGAGVSALIDELGTYTIAIDSTAPVITPSNFDTKGKTAGSFAALSSIRFLISDNFSGIGTYRATIDGKWVLMEYEPKKKLLWYTFDEHCGKGNHQLVLTVADKVGNVSVYRRDFSR